MSAEEATYLEDNAHYKLTIFNSEYNEGLYLNASENTDDCYLADTSIINNNNNFFFLDEEQFQRISVMGKSYEKFGGVKVDKEKKEMETFTPLRDNELYLERY